MIKGYCLNNLDKFDCFDFYNASFNGSSIPEHLFKSTLNQLFMKEDSENMKLSVDQNDDHFENKMSDLDNHSFLWLKLNIIRNYEYYNGLSLGEIDKYSKINFKNLDFIICKKENLYKVNVIVALFGLNRFNDLKTRRFLKKDFLLNLLNKLDFCHYKEDLNHFVKFLIMQEESFLKKKTFSFLLKYFEEKISSAKNDYLFFQYTSVFNLLIKAKMINKKFKSKDLSIYDENNKNSKYYELIKNLREEFKECLQTKYENYISKVDGFNFESAASSLSLIYNIQNNPADALNKFYNVIFKFYLNIKREDALYFNTKVLDSLNFLVQLSNESSKANELKLCSMLDLENIYNLKYPQAYQTNLISFLMLNEESFLKNFNMIKDFLLNVQSTRGLVAVIHLFKKHLKVLCKQRKVQVIEIFPYLLKIHLNQSRKDEHRKEIRIKKILKHKIIQDISKYISNETYLLSNEDKNNIFSYLSELNLLIDESDIKNYFSKNSVLTKCSPRLSDICKLIK